MDWKKSEPPKDREFLAFALALGIPEEVQPIRVVVAWEAAVEEWRPVKLPGDRITGTKVRVLCWAELPDVPKLE